MEVSPSWAAPSLPHSLRALSSASCLRSFCTSHLGLSGCPNMPACTWWCQDNQGAQCATALIYSSAWLGVKRVTAHSQAAPTFCMHMVGSGQPGCPMCNSLGMAQHAWVSESMSHSLHPLRAQKLLEATTFSCVRDDQHVRDAGCNLAQSWSLSAFC